MEDHELLEGARAARRQELRDAAPVEVRTLKRLPMEFWFDIWFKKDRPAEIPMEERDKWRKQFWYLNETEKVRNMIFSLTPLDKIQPLLETIICFSPRLVQMHILDLPNWVSLPPPAPYTKALCKWLNKKVMLMLSPGNDDNCELDLHFDPHDEDCEEITYCEEILAFTINNIASLNSSNDQGYATYNINQDGTDYGHLSIWCSNALGGELETGGRLWPAAHVLQRLLFDERLAEKINLTKDTNVLELGAGTGFAGLSLAKCGFNVSISDGMAQCVKNIQHNLEVTIDMHHNINHLSCEIDLLRWTDTPKTRFDYRFSMYPDLLIASDVVYDKDAVLPLVMTIKYFLTNWCKKGALIVCEERIPATWKCFIETVKMNGLQVTWIALDKTCGIFDLPEGGTLLDNGTFHAILLKL